MRRVIQDIGYGVYVVLACLRLLPVVALRPEPFGYRRFLAAFVEVGLRPFPTLTLLAALIGIIVGVGVGEALTVLKFEVLLVESVRAIVLREFAPLLVGVLIAGRSGVLLTARLGTMALAEETDAILAMGADPLRHAVLPVLAAAMLLAPLITAWCGLTTIAFSAVAVEWNSNMSTPQFLEMMLTGDAGHAFLYGLGKSVVFAVLVVATATVHGTRVVRDASLLPRMATDTFTHAFLAILGVTALFLVLDTYNG